MDAILEEAGSCGRFQSIHILLTQLPRIIAFWAKSFMVFGNYRPPWGCQQHEQQLLTNISSTTLDPASMSLQQDYFNETCSTLNTSTCSKIEFRSGSSTIVSDFELICDREWIPRVLISITMLGTFFGSLFGGQIGEWFGRRVGLYSSTAIMTIASGLTVLSVSWEMLAVVMFFLGFGDGGIMVSSLVHGMEFLNSWWRGAFSSIPFWNIGLVMFSMIVFILKDWRPIHIITAVAGLVSFLGVFWVPESVRWLVVHGQTEKAEQVVRRIAVTNKKPTLITEDRTHLNNIKDDGTTSGSKTTYLDLFRTKTLAFITTRLAIVWTFILMSYFAMNYGISALSGDFYMNFLVGSLVEIPPIVSTGFLANVFGRKKSTSMLMGVSASCCLASVLCRLFEVDSLASTIFVFVAKGCVFAAWNAITTLAIESFPTVVRNLGYGFLSMISRIGGVLCPLLIPQNETEFIVFYVIISCGLVLAILIVSSLTETKERALQNIIREESSESAV